MVLLGASNLTLYLRRVIGLLRSRCGGPSDVLVAAGHGRSYGQRSRVLLRALPGISACGLWTQLEASGDLPTCALLTDIGNDIPYGYKPDDILQWVGACAERLQRRDARIVVTNLPLARIESLSETRFRILRSILFPSSRLSKRDLVERSRAVHRGLRKMAASRGFRLYEPEADWFGPDVIHIRYRKCAEAYRFVVEGLTDDADPECPLEAGAWRALTWKKRPRFARQRILGRQWCCRQPSGQLIDGSRVSLY